MCRAAVVQIISRKIELMLGLLRQIQSFGEGEALPTNGNIWCSGAPWLRVAHIQRGSVSGGGGGGATPLPFRSPELPERAGTFCRNVVIL